MGVKLHVNLVVLLTLALVHAHTVHGATSTAPPQEQLQGHSGNWTSSNSCRITEACREHCESCTEIGTCCSCSPGWHGATCNQTCHINCYTCSRNGECDTCNNSNAFGPFCEHRGDVCKDGMHNRSRCTHGCIDGYFEAPKLPGMTAYYECVKCHRPCITCTSEDMCDSCIDKRWGETCNERCFNSSCTQCHKNTGVCLDDNCSWGRYKDQAGQCRHCPDLCRSCTSETQCRLCIGERYGNICEHVNCSSISNCAQCHCPHLQCFENDIICTKCDDGFTRDRCQITNTVEETSSPSANTSPSTTTPANYYDSLSEDKETGMATSTETILIHVCFGVVLGLAIIIIVCIYIAKKNSWRIPCSVFTRRSRNRYRFTPLFQICSSRTNDQVLHEYDTSNGNHTVALAPGILDQSVSNGHVSQV